VLRRFYKPAYGLQDVPLRMDSKPAANMGLNEMAGDVRNQIIVLSIYICAGRNICASNPPLR